MLLGSVRISTSEQHFDHQTDALGHAGVAEADGEWPTNHVADVDLPDGEKLLEKKLRPWPPGAVMQALLDQGLSIGASGEFPDSADGPWVAFSKWSDADRRTIRITYSVMAQALES